MDWLWRRLQQDTVPAKFVAMFARHQSR